MPVTITYIFFMAKKQQIKQQKPNRGRIQAQGTDGPNSNLEKSESWASDGVPTKTDGHTFVGNLKGQLTDKQLQIRQKAFNQVDRLIDRAPTRGIDAQFTNSYSVVPPCGKSRVDVEIRAGKAFRND